MQEKHVYQVGDKVFHGDFGEGLVVDVRNRLFYDVLEVVFPAGVKRVTSIHPLLRPKPVLTEVPPPKPPRRRRAPARKEETSESAKRSRLKFLSLDEDTLSILDDAERGRLDGHRAYHLHLEGEDLSTHRGFEKLQSLDSMIGIDRLEYQKDACLRLLREMRGRGLLADEVGLGKTVEAAMVLKEYMLRGLVRSALVLVPASLTVQWQEELATKCGLDFSIVGRRGDWAEASLVICSLDTAKTTRNRERLLDREFDMVIVDEAHRLRNHQTQAWKFVSSLPSKYLLLLTATPVQNDLRELYNLVNLLRPGSLGTYRSFRRKFMVRGDKRLPKNTSELSALLKSVMIRTTRAKTNIRFPSRSVEILPFRLTPHERRLYDAVTEFVRNRFTDQDRMQFLKWQFVSMVLQKEIGSSTPAARQTLAKARRDPRYSSHRGDLDRLLRLTENVEEHAKLTGLLELMQDIPDKAIVFTQFRSTMEFLARRLEEEGYRTTLFHGGLPTLDKEASIARFRDGAQVLVSTEAGGEGRNLQFCRTVINYDLPWNPMKIEQRIGRVHRLGQTGNIRIFNFSTEDTVESHVLEILHRKINMFQLVIGEMDMILGEYADNQSFEAAVFQIWAGSKHRRDLERRFRDLGDQLYLGKRRYEAIKQLDEEIFDG
jgi:SNF2 family DNA or RNA helicase